MGTRYARGHGRIFGRGLVVCLLSLPAAELTAIVVGHPWRGHTGPHGASVRRCGER
jgi:hypothetical protein